jgi:hypothetical protein
MDEASKDALIAEFHAIELQLWSLAHCRAPEGTANALTLAAELMEKQQQILKQLGGDLDAALRPPRRPR